MRDEVSLDAGGRVDERLAGLFRELCRKEFLDEHETEALVGQATSRPAAVRPRPGHAPAPVLRTTTARPDSDAPHRYRHDRDPPSSQRQSWLGIAIAYARDGLSVVLSNRWRAAPRRT